jgi:hypothetical protein
MKTLCERVAQALDLSLNDAANKRGIYTDHYRDILAAYLDGQAKLSPAKVRHLCKYLEP